MKRINILLLLMIAVSVSSCKKEGCTDPLAINYDESAEDDNGECIYETVSSGATLLDCQEFNQSGTEYELVDLGLAVDYRVDCQMPIACDLKILPGVTIEFTTDAGLEVSSTGSLNAIADLSQQGIDGDILFTGVDKAPGAWAGIYIDSEDVKNKLDGCKIEYAGGDYFNSNGDEGGLVLYSTCKADIWNTTITNCSSYGINCNYGGGDFSFVDNTISGCTFPMFIEAEYAGSISGGIFTGNTTDAIHIDSYAGAGNIETSQTWTNLGVPYRLLGAGSVQSHSDWIISPGVTIECGAGTEIRINDGKSLKALGTIDEPILFKGVNPGPGAWPRIYFDSTNSLNEIGHAIISGAGEDPTNSKGSVYLWYGAKLDIHNVQFTDNAACGVYGKLSSGSTTNPNYSSANLTFTNTGCTELFEN